MKAKHSPTIRVDVFVAGSFGDAVRVCQEFCMEGLCVTVEATTFVYTGGVEDGVRVGLLNYPRFPTTHEELKHTAMRLARLLVERLFQHSALVVCEQETVWISRRGDDAH